MPEMKKIILFVFAFLLFILSFSLYADAKKEDIPEPIVSGDMSLSQVAKSNKIPKEKIQKMLGIDGNQDAKIDELPSVSVQQVHQAVFKLMALKYENSRKNWKKIFLKFGLWSLYIVIGIVLLTRRKVTRAVRILFLFIAVILFGLIFGSDPSPMGTVKDTIVMKGVFGVFFRPRTIAFFIFIAMVIVGNKMICGWGCQFGTFQDLLYTATAKRKKKGFGIPKFKIPFWLSMTIRTLTFLAIIYFALLHKTDIIGPVDPFAIFNLHPGWLAGGAAIFLLILSLFTYRPWCQLFCPFGWTAWFAEKVSIFRVRIDRDTCIECQKCVKNGPCNAIKPIWEQHGVVADCYSCGRCVEVCPTGAATYAFIGAKGRFKGPATGKENLKKQKADLKSEPNV